MSWQEILLIVFICLLGVVSLALWVLIFFKWRKRRYHQKAELKLKVQSLSQYVRNNWLFLLTLFFSFLTIALLVLLLRNLVTAFQ